MRLTRPSNVRLATAGSYRVQPAALSRLHPETAVSIRRVETIARASVVAVGLVLLDHACTVTFCILHCALRASVLLPVRHRSQEVRVRLGLAHLRQQQLHRLDRGERVQHLAEHPDPVEVLLRDEQLLFARAALLDINRGEHAAIGQLPIEVNLHVA